MHYKEARVLCWIILVIGCILIVFGKRWLALAAIAAGLLVGLLLVRCPHCGRNLMGTPLDLRRCPRCHKKLKGNSHDSEKRHREKKR